MCICDMGLEMDTSSTSRMVARAKESSDQQLSTSPHVSTDVEQQHNTLYFTVTSSRLTNPVLEIASLSRGNT
jgi:hypothetical protein